MKCFYHDDMDGRCAGAIVSFYESNNNPKDFIEINYNSFIDTSLVSEGEKVYIVDLSINDNNINILTELKSKNCKIIWIDHHKTSIDFKSNHTDILDNIEHLLIDDYSGAALTYMYINDISNYNDLPMYVQLVSDYDTWSYKHNPMTTYFKLGIENRDHNALDYVWIALESQHLRGKLQTLNDICSDGNVIKKFIDKNNEYYRNAFSYESIIDGNKCIVVNYKTNSWIFGDMINSYDCGVVWVYDGKRYNYSVFSTKDNIDCAKIAEKFGGGGHKGAAGFNSYDIVV